MEAGRCSRIIVRRQKNNVADMIMTKSDWDYRGLAAECYDLWFGDEPFWDQAFFHDRIRRNGGTALEIACGTGRLLVPFLRDGLAVHGMDASEEMLAICRTKAAHVGLTPTLYHQLMQDLDLAEYNHTVSFRRARSRYLRSAGKRSRRYDAFISILIRTGSFSSP